MLGKSIQLTIPIENEGMNIYGRKIADNCVLDVEEGDQIC